MTRKLKHGDNLDVFGRDYIFDHSRTSKQLDEQFGFRETLGITDPNEKRIYIAVDANEDEKSFILLHEIIEAIKFIFGWEKKLPEDDVLKLESSLGYTLKKNGIGLWEI